MMEHKVHHKGWPEQFVWDVPDLQDGQYFTFKCVNIQLDVNQPAVYSSYGDKSNPGGLIVELDFCGRSGNIVTGLDVKVSSTPVPGSMAVLTKDSPTGLGTSDKVAAQQDLFAFPLYDGHPAWQTLVNNVLYVDGSSAWIWPREAFTVQELPRPEKILMVYSLQGWEQYCLANPPTAPPTSTPGSGTAATSASYSDGPRNSTPVVALAGGLGGFVLLASALFLMKSSGRFAKETSHNTRGAGGWKSRFSLASFSNAQQWGADSTNTAPSSSSMWGRISARFGGAGAWGHQHHHHQQQSQVASYGPSSAIAPGSSPYTQSVQSANPYVSQYSQNSHASNMYPSSASSHGSYVI
jgi:hypothetical protein